MCGRFELHSAFEIIAQIFGLAGGVSAVPASYNITPGQDIAIITKVGGNNRLSLCHWGFVPSWCKELSEGYKMINARSETVAEKPSFRQAFSRHRCLVVADGFYEWKNEGGKKKPVYVHLKSGMPFGMVGLYNLWTSPEGEQVCTCTIITTDANESLKPIHDRMPVIAPPDKYDLWLDPGVQEKEKLLQMLKPYPDKELELYEVSTRVNSPKNDSAENIQKIK
ncbi:MAG: SOS response-associated peptidase [Nitrospirae bacterium]|nr:SOS response-associated peptidase [Nitrospirota bacterium]NTW67844.1 SOS response-associated peptidase [Nitrospirota bacterium]